MMTYVAIDTNVIPNGWRLRSRPVETLSKFLHQTGSKLLLSDVVLIELESNFQRESNQALNNLVGAMSRLRSIGIEIAEIDREKLFSDAVSYHTQAFTEMFPPSIVERVQLRGDSIEDVVRRLADRRKPASPEGEQFRDCVIWSDLLAHCKENPLHHPIAFISTDKAFSADKLSFHLSLQQELDEQGIPISYYATIEDFLKSQNFDVSEPDLLGGVELNVTDGWLKVPGFFRGPQFNLVAPGINVRGGNADPGGVEAQRCMPCVANQPISLNSTFAGNLGLGSGPATISGVTYERLFYAGAIHFFGETNVPETNSEKVLLSSSFTFLGSLKAFKQNLFTGNPGEPVFDVNLTGKGTVEVELASYPHATLGRLYSFRNMEYNFES